MSESKYKQEYCEILRKHLSEGFSVESCFYKLGCGKTTFYEWVKVHPEFAHAKLKGESEGLELDEKFLKVLLTGIGSGKLDPKKMNVSALLFKLKTQRSKIYGEHIKHEIDATEEAKDLIKLAYKKKSNE